MRTASEQEDEKPWEYRLPLPLVPPTRDQRHRDHITPVRGFTRTGGLGPLTERATPGPVHSLRCDQKTERGDRCNSLFPDVHLHAHLSLTMCPAQCRHLHPFVHHATFHFKLMHGCLCCGSLATITGLVPPRHQGASSIGAGGTVVG